MGEKLSLVARDFMDVSADEVFDLICDVFDNDTTFEQIQKPLAGNAVISEAVVSRKSVEEQKAPLAASVQVEQTVAAGEIIDVNSCSEEELTELPGISVLIAKKIVKHRKENGGFKSVDEFITEMGIKPQYEKQIRPIIKTEEIVVKKVKKVKEERIIDF